MNNTLSNHITFVTGNKDKYQDAATILKKYGFLVEQHKLEIVELQDVDGESIARHKAEQAYDQLEVPLFVNDTIWMVPALNNFPGAFMKYTNDCFTPNDWLRLMKDVKDRRVVMREILVYKDGKSEKLMYKDVVGVFLEDADGKDGVSSDKVISFSEDGISIAKARDAGNITTASKKGATSYDLLGEWLCNNQS